MIKDKHWVTIGVSKLVKASWNYKRDDKEKADKLRANIERNGQVQNIIVREIDDGRFEVVNGNHRLDVFLTMGAEDAVCYNLGKISLKEAQRVAIETNETSFETDDIALSKLLAGLVSDFPVEELQTTMPFSDKELGEMIRLADFDWTKFDNSVRGDKDKPPKHPSEPMTCPQCGYVLPNRQ